MATKVCTKCKILTEESNCPICSGNQFSETWKGKVIIINPEESILAKKLKISKAGTYAIKIR